MLLTELIQAISLFGLGMGTVFVLLSLLISCVSLLSYVCQNFLPEAQGDQTPGTPTAQINNAAQNVSELEVSIVKAAVNAHRKVSA